MLKNSSILITGGTGSFGQNFLGELLKKNLNKIIIFSRDELKQYNLKKKYSKNKNYNKIRFFAIRLSVRIMFQGKDLFALMFGRTWCSSFSAFYFF